MKTELEIQKTMVEAKFGILSPSARRAMKVYLLLKNWDEKLRNQQLDIFTYARTLQIKKFLYEDQLIEFSRPVKHEDIVKEIFNFMVQHNAESGEKIIERVLKACNQYRGIINNAEKKIQSYSLSVDLKTGLNRIFKNNLYYQFSSVFMPSGNVFFSKAPFLSAAYDNKELVLLKFFFSLMLLGFEIWNAQIRGISYSLLSVLIGYCAPGFSLVNKFIVQLPFGFDELTTLHYAYPIVKWLTGLGISLFIHLLDVAWEFDLKFALGSYIFASIARVENIFKVIRFLQFSVSTIMRIIPTIANRPSFFAGAITKQALEKATRLGNAVLASVSNTQPELIKFMSFIANILIFQYVKVKWFEYYYAPTPISMTDLLEKPELCKQDVQRCCPEAYKNLDLNVSISPEGKTIYPNVQAIWDAYKAKVLKLHPDKTGDHNVDIATYRYSRYRAEECSVNRIYQP